MSDAGVTNLMGLAAPDIGFVNESSRKKSCETDRIQNQLGVTKCVTVLPLVKIDTSIKGKGDPGLGDLVAASITVKGQIATISQKRDELAGKYPDFERSGMGYDDLPAAVSTEAGDPVIPAPAEGSVCPVQGIVSCGISNVTTFTLEESIETTEPLLKTDGTFEQFDLFDPHFDFSIKGRGDFPVILSLGGDGGLPDTVAEFGTGSTLVLSSDESQKMGDYGSFDASGEHWPSAE